MERFEFTIGEDVIPYFLGKQCFDDIADELIKIGKENTFDKVFICCDENIKQLHADAFAAALRKKNINYDICESRSGEKNKSMATLDHVINFLLTHGCTRRSILIPFGGGIVGNTFGLAAALLYRGIRFIHVPSTFLSAHDSVTSKKQAINHSGLKNIVGTYYVPTAIMCNVSVFETLTPDNIRSGSGELTKNAILFGKEHFDTLYPILVRRRGDLRYTEDEVLALMRLGIQAKGALLRDDPKERTTAIIFEYGHTVGHALELTYGVSHGCAVALGMYAASFIANKMGIMSDEDRAAHDSLIDHLDVKLPLAPTEELERRAFERCQGDNKRGYIPFKDGHYPLILAKKIGEMHHPNPYYLEYVEESVLKEAIHHVTHSHYTEDPEEQQAAAVLAAKKIHRPMFLSRLGRVSVMAQAIHKLVSPYVEGLVIY